MADHKEKRDGVNRKKDSVTLACTYDFVVDAGGDGTHTTLFGASGALEAAMERV